ncbi:MAG: response regulator [Candidatus Hydrothermarchaeales archaeon]
MNRILVVDDDVQIQKDLSEILGEEGYEVSTVGTGEEALETMGGEDAFDLVISDLMMHGMGGMELLTEIKKRKKDLPVVMVTGFATIDSAVEAMRKGASDYIPKPFKINEVEMVVRRTFEEKRFKDGLRESRSSKERGEGMNEVLNSLANPIRRDAMESLHLRGTSSFMNLVDDLDLEDHTKLSFHLRKLKSSGIVEQDKEKRYALSVEGKKILKLLVQLEKEISSS